MKTIECIGRYFLNEEIRKQLVLEGRDCHYIQVVKKEIDSIEELSKILPYANLTEDGQIVIDLTKENKVVIGYKLKWFNADNSYTKIPIFKNPFTFSKSNTQNIYEFDSEQTFDDLLSFEIDRRKKLQKNESLLEKEIEEKNKELKLKEEEKRKKKELKEEKKKKFESEMQLWISEHGSDYLKKCQKFGIYSFNEYLTERLQFENLSDFTLLTDSQIHEMADTVSNMFSYYSFGEIFSPSEESLNRLEKLKEANHQVKLVWLHKEKKEMLIIENYLNQYTLVKIYI